jgi:hypothetical protein
LTQGAATRDTLANGQRTDMGVKWTGGEATGKLALVALVAHKVPEDELPEGDRLPHRRRAGRRLMCSRSAS